MTAICQIRYVFPWLALIFLTPLPAQAWNATGHRLVACVAWEHLKPSTRVEVGRLLQFHPDQAVWARKAGGHDGQLYRALFIEASTWPDDIRHDDRFYTPGKDEPTSPRPGFPDMQRHLDWHYVQSPIDGSSAPVPPQGILDREITALAADLASRRSTTEAKAYALPWLIHLVGGAHQPLHVSLRENSQGRRDKLRRGFGIINPFNPRKRRSTLHVFWDDLPSAFPLRGQRLDSACRKLIASHPFAPPPANSDQWIEESWQIAHTHAYPPSAKSPTVLTEEFVAEAKNIAEQRVAAAGYRLADWLNGLLGRGRSN